MKQKMRNMRVVGKVCIFLLLVFIAMLALLSIWAFVGGTSVTAMRLLQSLQSLVVFILPCLVCAYLWSEKPWDYLSLSTFSSGKMALFSIGMMMLAQPAINLLAYWNQQLVLPEFLRGLEAILQAQEAAAALLTEQLLQMPHVGYLFLNLLVMALLPAISEELIFRGILIRFFIPPISQQDSNLSPSGGSRRGLHISIWTSAILFSLIHFQFYGFVPRMLMGAFFGYLLLWSGSLWMPILAHFTNNALVVILSYLSQKGYISTDFIESFGTGNTIWVGVVCLLIFFLICVFRKNIVPLQVENTN